MDIFSLAIIRLYSLSHTHLPKAYQTLFCITCLYRAACYVINIQKYDGDNVHDKPVCMYPIMTRVTKCQI
jgi:hypothetical protein